LQHSNVSPEVLALLYTTMAAAATVAATRLWNLACWSDQATKVDINEGGKQADKRGICDKAFLTVSLWSDPLIWLLSPLNMCFGFSAALMNGYVNARITMPTLGRSWVAGLAGVTVLVSAVCAKIFAKVAQKIGALPIVSIGAFAFFTISCLLMLCDNIRDWGQGIVLLYCLQGIGRAVYESTNRSLFADFFPEQAEAAFSNCMLQSAASFAICFALQARIGGIGGAELAATTIAFAPLSTLGLVVAKRIKRQRESKISFDNDYEALGA